MNAVESNEFCLVIDSAGGARPAAGLGATVTPGFNTYGSYVTLLTGAQVTDEALAILVNVNSIGVNASATDTLATIAIDPAGGTAFAGNEIINDLLVSCAIPYAAATGAVGVEYYFQLRIPAGASVGIKMQQNNATPLTGKAFVRLYCQPTRPDLIRVGQRVVTYGITSASSSGTPIMPGTTSDGAFVQVGTIAAGDFPWQFQVGIGINNAAISTSEVLHVDLAVGQAGARKFPILDQRVLFTTSEQVGMQPPRDGQALGAPGELVYVRAQSSNTVQTGISAAAYGVCS